MFDTLQGRLSVLGIPWPDGDLDSQDRRTLVGIPSEPDIAPLQPPVPPIATPDPNVSYNLTVTVKLIAPVDAEIIYVLDDADVKVDGAVWLEDQTFTNDGPDILTVTITTYCFNADGDSGIVVFTYTILPPPVVDPDPVEPDLPPVDVELPVASVSDVDLEADPWIIEIPNIDTTIEILF